MNGRAFVVEDDFQRWVDGLVDAHLKPSRPWWWWVAFWIAIAWVGGAAIAIWWAYAGLPL